MRLFLAVPLPETLLRALSEVARDLRATLPGWRWARVEGIHLTLRFLGEVPEEALASQSSAWRSVVRVHPPMHLEAGGVGTFPSRRHPRVLWVGLRETANPGALAALAAALEDEARRLGFAPERRGFTPHLTLARAAAPAAAAPAPDRVATLGRFQATSVALFRSELGPGGARYTALESYPLEREAAR